MEYTQADRDRSIKQDVKITQICTTIHKLDEKIDKMFVKLDNAAVDCPIKRGECRKELDTQMDDKHEKLEKKISAKVDWSYLTLILTVAAIVLGILKYGT